MRIQKYLSEKKIMSRRGAEKSMLAGKIKVNGEVVKDLGRQIDPGKDKVEVSPSEPKITVLFHKPRGISSSKVKSEGKNIFDLVPQFQHLNAIGRLDKESEGLILLSNDGVLTNIITGGEHLIEKEYLVEVRERVLPTKIKALSQGMLLSDGPTLPAKANLIGDYVFSLTLKEGRNHQIRRMADKIGLTIVKLKRVRIGSIHLGKTPIGGFRLLQSPEVDSLKHFAF